MIFNSFQFIWLFPVIFIVYWAVGLFLGMRKKQEGMQYAASDYFLWPLCSVEYCLYSDIVWGHGGHLFFRKINREEWRIWKETVGCGVWSVSVANPAFGV